ncbi:hypothetical protein [Candidatus Igneacidithiobacillus taiwanensis]|nr:hypothetical protein [Candidatus Igneacidithiobacillus taiwanensis]
MSRATGSARKPLLALRGEHINLQKRTTLVIDPKNGEDRMVPPSSRVIY